jgi:hypothetical protein
MGEIMVFLADDSVFVREDVQAMFARHADLTTVGIARAPASIETRERLAENALAADIELTRDELDAIRPAGGVGLRHLPGDSTDNAETVPLTSD